MRWRLFSPQEQLELGWWVEISTTAPHCTYYFSPFACETSARSSQDGYIEDLEGEEALGIAVWVKKCQPQQLTLKVQGEV